VPVWSARVEPVEGLRAARTPIALVVRFRYWVFSLKRSKRRRMASGERQRRRKEKAGAVAARAGRSQLPDEVHRSTAGADARI